MFGRAPGRLACPPLRRDRLDERVGGRRRPLEGAPEGLVAVADHQSAGRGRLGRTWEAPARQRRCSARSCCARRSTWTTSSSCVAGVSLSLRAALVRLCGRAARPQVAQRPGRRRRQARRRPRRGRPDRGRPSAVVVGFGVNLSDVPRRRATSVSREAGVTRSRARRCSTSCSRSSSRVAALARRAEGRAALRDRVRARPGDARPSRPRRDWPARSTSASPGASTSPGASLVDVDGRSARLRAPATSCTCARQRGGP